MSATLANRAEADPAPSYPEPPVLEARALSGRHVSGAGGNVFENINLAVKEGEVVCLLGASGCGKSSLLRTLAGLVPAHDGGVFLRDESVRGPHPKIGFVFQKAALLPWLSVWRNIRFGLTLSQSPRLTKAELHARIDSALDDVGLHGAGKMRPSQLSGGMAQRVSLARALAREPAVLLLDEPLGALDAITRLEMQKLILEAAGRHGIAVLWVTHDIDEALLVADRVLLMDRQPGRVVAEWTIAAPRPRFGSLDVLLPLRNTILAALSEVAGLIRSNTSTTNDYAI